jgi:hypothetical protein
MTYSVVRVSLRSQGMWNGKLHTTTPPMSNSIAVGGLDGPGIVLKLAKKYHGAVKVSWRIVASHGRCCRKVGGAWWTSAERAWSIDNRDCQRSAAVPISYSTSIKPLLPLSN